MDGNTTMGLLTPYMNYVRIQSSGNIDNVQTLGTVACNGTNRPCLILHNGAAIRVWRDCRFNGTTQQNGCLFGELDPDGKVTGAGDNGPGKAVDLWLYYNGRLATTGTLTPNTTSSAHADISAIPSYDPPWLQW